MEALERSEKGCLNPIIGCSRVGRFSLSVISARILARNVPIPSKIDLTDPVPGGRGSLKIRKNFWFGLRWPTEKFFGRKFFFEKFFNFCENFNILKIFPFFQKFLNFSVLASFSQFLIILVFLTV